MRIPLLPRNAVPALVAAGLCLVAAPLLSQTGGMGPDDLDERMFHLPTVLQFQAQLPWPDLRDYPSATSPLHHLLLALVAAVASSDLLLLRVANLAFAALGLAVVGWHLSRDARPWTALTLALPLMLSPYWLGPAIRISTDDAALVWVFISLAALWASARSATATPWWLAVVAAIAAIWTRQLHLWLAAPLAIAAWWPHLLGSQHLRSPQRLAAVGLLPLSLVPLLWAWRGLVPPSFARAHEGLGNPAAAQLLLAVLALVGVFFAPTWLPAARTPRARMLALAAAAVAAASLVIWPLPWEANPNRIAGAAWMLAGLGPNALGSAALLWVLVPAGAAVAVLLVWAEGSTGTWLVALSLPPWILANAANERAYHKYYEPFLLFLLAHAASRVAPNGRWTLLGPAALALAYLAVDALRFIG
jgi:hypothetical protein